MFYYALYKQTAVDIRLHKQDKKSQRIVSPLIPFKSSTAHCSETRRHSLSWRLSIVRRDGTSPWDLPGGLNTHRPPWTSTDALHDPQRTLPLSHSLSLAVTHADEMFFNTQSTVLTSPWVAGSPEGHKLLILGGLWVCGPPVTCPQSCCYYWEISGAITPHRPDGSDAGRSGSLITLHVNFLEEN